MSRSFPLPKTPPSVSVILNVYKRSENFQAQLRAIAAQTLPVRETLVWENGEEVSPEPFEALRARSDLNLGVWARFAYALNSSSEFVWIIDDDAIPEPGWLESALRTHALTGGLVGSRGLRFRTTSSYTLYDEFGPNNPNDKVEEVDIVGHNWVFPREWLGAFWAELGSRFHNNRAGEDIHLSYAAQKHLGVGTFVPPHPANNRSIWGEQPADEASFGRDEHAISRSMEAMKKFEEAYSHYIRIGFKPLCTRSEVFMERSRDRVLGSAVRVNPGLAHKVARLLRLAK